MPRTRRPLHPRQPSVSEPTRPRAGAITVASLGVRVRLVPAEGDRARDLARLITACETLSAEQRHLLQRIKDILSESARHNGDRTPAPSGRQ